MAGLKDSARRLFYVLAAPQFQKLARVNLMFVSDPGEGKTSFGRQVARWLGITDEHFVRWSIGQHDPMDANGWATPRDEGLVFEPPMRIKDLTKNGGGIWLLDEVGQAPATVQGAFLKVLDERWVGDTQLPPSVHIIGATNPPETGAASQDTTRPFANRCIWLTFSGPTKEEHAAFISGRGEVEAMELPTRKSAEEWDAQHSITVALYTAYMTRCPTAVLREDAKSDEIQARFTTLEATETGERVFCPAYATPRTWDVATQAYTSATLYGDKTAGLDFVCGAVGRPQGLGFCHFADEQDLVDPEVIIAAILAGTKVEWAPDVKRPDRTFAQLHAVAIAGCRAGMADKERNARWHAAWMFLKAARNEMGVPKDLCLVAGEHLGANRVKGQLLASVEDIIRELAPMVAATRA